MPKKNTIFESKYEQLRQNAIKDLQQMYPGKNVDVVAVSNYRDPKTQAALKQKGASTTDVSLHGLNAAKDFQIYVDGKPIKNKKVYHDILWKNAEHLGLYHLDPNGFGAVDLGHIGVIEEDGKTTMGRLIDQYPEITETDEFKNLYNFLDNKKQTGLTSKEDTVYQQLQGTRFEPELWFKPMYPKDNDVTNTQSPLIKKEQISSLKPVKIKAKNIVNHLFKPEEKQLPSQNVVYQDDDIIKKLGLSELKKLDISSTFNKPEEKNVPETSTINSDYNLTQMFLDEWKNKEIYSQIPQTDIVSVAKNGAMLKKTKKKYAAEGVTSENPIGGATSMTGKNPYAYAYQSVPSDTTKENPKPVTQPMQNDSSIQTPPATPQEAMKRKKSFAWDSANLIAGTIAGANMLIPEMYKPKNNQNPLMYSYNPYGSGDSSQAIFKEGGKVAPIYVDSKDDPRYRAYYDSSLLHTLSYNQYNELPFKGDPLPYDRPRNVAGQQVTYPTLENQGPVENTYQITPTIGRRRYKNPKNLKHIEVADDYVHPTIKPEYGYFGGSGDPYSTNNMFNPFADRPTTSYNYLYKEPVQPVFIKNKTENKTNKTTKQKQINKQSISAIPTLNNKSLDLYSTEVQHKYDVPDLPITPSKPYSIQLQNRDPKLKNYNQRTIEFDTDKEMQDYIRSNKLHNIGPGSYENTMAYGGSMYAYNGQHGAANGMTLTPQDRDAWERMQSAAYQQGFLGSDHSKQPGVEFMRQYGVDPAKLSAYQADFQNFASVDPSRINYSTEGLSGVDDFYGHKTAQQRYKKYQVFHNDKEVFAPSTDLEGSLAATDKILNSGWENYGKSMLPSTPGYEGFEQRYNQEVQPLYAQPVAKVNKASFYEGDGENTYSIDDVRSGEAKYGSSLSPEYINDLYNLNAVSEYTEKAKDGKWIQKAVNPKHKGYCTPMTKETCTPRRKAFAKTMKKHHGFHKAEEGDMLNAYNNNHYTQNGGSLGEHIYDLTQPLRADNGVSVEGNSYSMLSPFTGKLGGRYHTNGGTDIAFGGRVIEAEKEEILTKDPQGNLVIFGNMKVPGTNIKFKKAGELIGEEENKVSRLSDKTTKILNRNSKVPTNRNLDLQTAEVLTSAVGAYNQDIQNTKNALIDTQNQMLSIAERLGVEPKKISKQLEAKMGKVMKKGCADCGTKMKALGGTKGGQNPDLPYNEFLDKVGRNPIIDKLPITYPTGQYSALPVGDPYANLKPSVGIPAIQPEFKMMPATPEAINPQQVAIPEFTPQYNEESFVDNKKKAPSKQSLTKYNKMKMLSLLPEMSVLAERIDPVFNPQINADLYNPYQVSYQDRRNLAQADYNSLIKALPNNPALAAQLQGQKRSQDDQTNAEEFRINQGINADVIAKNNALVNDIKRLNATMAADQMDKQLRSKAVTKDRKLSALSSIVSKYQQHQAENNKLRQIESMTDYRYNPVTGEFEYVGGKKDFVPGTGVASNNSDDITEEYDNEGNLLKRIIKKKSSNKDKQEADKAKKSALSKWGNIFRS